MSEISVSIEMQAQITPALQSIASAIETMYHNFANVQNSIDAALSASNTGSASWDLVTQPVFMSSGETRFAQEYQAANEMAQRLYQKQQIISAQARQMRVVPPGMLNEMAATDNRLQALAMRIQQIDKIPVNLRTDKMNNDLEEMRSQLVQAVEIQKELNNALERMDISEANRAYRQLNSIAQTTEQSIRDNFMAQSQFNETIQAGKNNASRLGSFIKRYADNILNIANIEKTLGLADTIMQTTARVDLMNQQFGESGNLLQRIYESAQRSRGAYQATVDTVTSLGTQTQGVFSNTNEIIAFTEQLNKSFAIAGTSAQGIDTVMLQITEAMAAGGLQGEQLNTVLENAQPIVKNIADYMGVPIEQIKNLASEGAITAEIIKNAMFQAADETEQKFSQTPITFGQAANNAKNQLFMAFQPALQQLSAMLQTESFGNLINSGGLLMQNMASMATQALMAMGQAIMFVQENFWWLLPAIGGVVAAVVAYQGALAAYNIVRTIGNTLDGIAAIQSAAHAMATQGQATATFSATAAQHGFNLALLTCPLTWIVLLIIAVIVAIIAWINHIGGLKIAWLVCVDAVMTKAESLQLAFMSVGMHIQNAIDMMQYTFASFTVGVLNFLGNLKVQGLSILQEFVNGAIDRINSFISTVNSITGTSIEMIAHVEFASGAAIEEQAKQAQREADLAALKEQNAAARLARQTEYEMKKRAVEEARAQREAAIEAAKAEREEEKKAEDDTYPNGYSPESVPYEELPPNLSTIGDNTGATAGNTAAMADSMTMLDEDLEYLRDLAEQEVINRFTTAELTVNMGGITNQVNSNMDLDGIGNYLEGIIFERLETAAEGVY